MNRVSGRIWVLIAGIMVAVALTISAFAVQMPEKREAASPGRESKAPSLPSVLLKKISSGIEPLKPVR